jgi:hypothetical protein
MTRQEFILAKKRSGRQVDLPMFASLAVMVILPFVWMDFLSSHPDISFLSKMAGHMLCVVVLVFTVWFVYVHLARIEKRLDFCCPSCRKGFAATEARVLSSGRCYYCGYQVIDEPPNTALEPTPTAP